MRRIAHSILLLALMASPVLAADLVNVSGASRVALDGYDPVAFFTDGAPANGSPSIKATYRGAEYFFATEEHKKLFTESPETYAPQYGGFCAFGVGRGALFPVDITTWQIRNGKLYLNLDHDILQKFNADFDGNVVMADKNWPDLVRKNASYR